MQFEAVPESVSFESLVDNIEALQETDLDAARKAFRLLLFEQAGVKAQGSIGDALALLAEESTRHPQVAAILIRFLAVPNLVPEDIPQNQIARNSVEIVRGSQPDLADFLGISPKLQTHENYLILKGAHERLCAYLAPLKKQATTLELFLANRHPIIQAVNRSTVRAYCTPFGLNEAVNCVDQIFACVRKVSTSDHQALHQQIKSFRDIIETLGRPLEKRKNFFFKEFFSQFLLCSIEAIERYVAETRGRLAATLAARLAEGNSLPKHYPLLSERAFTLQVPFRNQGPGTALNVQAEISYEESAIYFGQSLINLGTIPPGDFSVAFDALVMQTQRSISVIITLTWEEMGDPSRRSLTQEIEILGQKIDVPWAILQLQHPYSTDVAKGDEFVGRKEKVVALASKILRTPMEPFYVTGQKRIGKTSLALAAADFAKAQSKDVDYKYILWGTITHPDPKKSLDALGRQVAEFIERSFPSGYGQDIPFDGSLAPLLSLAEKARELGPKRKYVVIIDEFDEIHPELYLHGNLAEAFFGNLRALAASENVCLVFVGGENMPFILERQGQKLNRFVRFGLDYFSRVSEWDDFKLLVRKPTETNINWHDEAVTEIFNLTNGNPYFAKFVCANVFAKAVREHDADVTRHEVQSAINTEITNLDSNSFAHLWQDGIYRAGPDREPIILQRCRVLVAIARTLRRDEAITLENLLANKHSPRLLAPDISAVLNDFMRREILTEHEGQYSFSLPVFGRWLKDVGIARLVSDSLAQELAEAAQLEEDNAYVESDEVSSLTKSWPTYRGKEIGSDDIRSWFSQVSSHKDQRLLFTLLENLKVFSEAEIREKLQMGFSFIRSKLSEFVIRKKTDRRTDVVVTYVDGEGKSGQYYAARFAEENRIYSQCIMSPIKFSMSFDAYLKKYKSAPPVVLIDDIVATGDTLSRKLATFMQENEIILKENKVPIVAIAIAATADGEKKVRETIQHFGWADFDLRICDPLPDEAFAFKPGNKIWGNDDDRMRAKALCQDIGVNIYPDAPLGYGDQALLVVFPETCPNNSLPIIHSAARPDSKRKWNPLFLRIAN